MHIWLRDFTIRCLKTLGLYTFLNEVYGWCHRHVYWHLSHHRRTRSFYGEFISDDDLCFDIGANMGEKAALFSELGARVICVEPQPSCLENLSRRFGKNPRITIVAAGAGAHLGNAQIAVCDDDPGVSTMSEKWRFQGRFASKRSWSHTVNVPLTTLDALIAQYGTPAFCKIDVEGFEVEVLKGLSQPIRCISFEFSSEFLEDTAICIKHLQRIGNPQFRFSPGDSMRFDTSSWLNGDDMMMHLSSLEGEYPWGDIYAKFDV